MQFAFLHVLGERSKFIEINIKDLHMTYFTGFVELYCVVTIRRDLQCLHKSA